MGEYLKERRLQKGLTQREVADIFKYETPQFISNWERGVSMPPIAALKKLGSLYAISAEELFDKTLEVTIKTTTKNLRKKFAETR